MIDAAGAAYRLDASNTKAPLDGGSTKPSFFNSVAMPKCPNCGVREQQLLSEVCR
jgi:hypothetical protein